MIKTFNQYVIESKDLKFNSFEEVQVYYDLGLIDSKIYDEIFNWLRSGLTKQLSLIPEAIDKEIPIILPDDMIANCNILIAHCKAITIPNNLTVNGNVRISLSNITKINSNLTVNGLLSIVDCGGLSELPNTISCDEFYIERTGFCAKFNNNTQMISFIIKNYPKIKSVLNKKQYNSRF